LALFKKSDGVYLFDFQKYDFVHQTEVFWGKNIGDIAWAPDNSKIAYFYGPASGEKTLIFANIANTEPTRVANLADYQIDNPYLSWSPDSRYLILIPRNKDYSQDKVYLYDTYSGALKETTELGDQIAAKFSPDNSLIVYSTYSKGDGDTEPFVISVMNKDGAEQKSLDLRTGIDNIAWLDPDSILAAEYRRSSGNVTFLIYDLASKIQSETIESMATKIVNKIEAFPEDGIALFENADGIFAFRLK
jgi:Tol biopolymer transport system component